MSLLKAPCASRTVLSKDFLSLPKTLQSRPRFLCILLGLVTLIPIFALLVFAEDFRVWRTLLATYTNVLVLLLLYLCFRSACTIECDGRLAFAFGILARGPTLTQRDAATQTRKETCDKAGHLAGLCLTNLGHACIHVRTLEENAIGVCLFRVFLVALLDVQTLLGVFGDDGIQQAYTRLHQLIADIPHAVQGDVCLHHVQRIFGAFGNLDICPSTGLPAALSRHPLNHHVGHAVAWPRSCGRITANGVFHHLNVHRNGFFALILRQCLCEAYLHNGER